MDTLEIIRQLQGDPALKAELRAVLRHEPDSETVELAKNSSVAIAQKEERIIIESMFIQPEG